jgi:hypothetical protein
MKQVTLLEKYFYLLANAHSEYECIEDWVLDKTNADEVKEYNKDLVSNRFHFRKCSTDKRRLESVLNYKGRMFNVQSIHGKYRYCLRKHTCTSCF